MARVVEKPHNGGTWTAARFKGFIISALRSASNRWPPKYQARKNAKVAYGKYTCAGYNKDAHVVRASEIQIDHIEPVIDPKTGFVDFDTFISRLFTEAENFQVLCKTCHQSKSNDEKVIRIGNKA